MFDFCIDFKVRFSGSRSLKRFASRALSDPRPRASTLDQNWVSKCNHFSFLEEIVLSTLPSKMARTIPEMGVPRRHHFSFFSGVDGMA